MSKQQGGFTRYGFYSPVVSVFSQSKVRYKSAALTTPIGVIDISWLPQASELYRISDNPENYVFAVKRIVTADLPNRNGDGFPIWELKRFDPMTGKAVYQSFMGKPTYEEHRQVFEESKGVIFDARLINEGAYTLIQTVSGWDKTKDPALAEGIRTKTRPFFSMGARVGVIICSICGKAARENNEFCTHLLNQKHKIITGKLCYEVCTDVLFVEESNVKVPADLRARHMGLDLI